MGMFVVLGRRVVVGGEVEDVRAPVKLPGWGH